MFLCVVFAVVVAVVLLLLLLFWGVCVFVFASFLGVLFVSCFVFVCFLFLFVCLFLDQSDLSIEPPCSSLRNKMGTTHASLAQGLEESNVRTEGNGKERTEVEQDIKLIKHTHGVEVNCPALPFHFPAVPPVCLKCDINRRSKWSIQLSLDVMRKTEQSRF